MYIENHIYHKPVSVFMQIIAHFISLLHTCKNMLLSYLLFAIGEKSNNKMYLLFPAFYYYCFLLIA